MKAFALTSYSTGFPQAKSGPRKLITHLVQRFVFTLEFSKEMNNFIQILFRHIKLMNIF